MKNKVELSEDDEEEKIITSGGPTKTPKQTATDTNKSTKKQDVDDIAKAPEYIEFAWFKDNLKILVGQYISKWKKFQYEIIETFVRMSVFENKDLKKDYLEEIMNFRSHSKYILQLDKYMKSNNIIKAQSKPVTTKREVIADERTKTPVDTNKGDKTTKDVDDENEEETILYTEKWEIKIEQDSYKEMIIWLSNKCIYFLNMSLYKYYLYFTFCIMIFNYRNLFHETIIKRKMQNVSSRTILPRRSKLHVFMEL